MKSDRGARGDRIRKMQSENVTTNGTKETWLVQCLARGKV